MKSADHRDAMVRRVQDAYAAYPSVASLPVGGKESSGGAIISVRVPYEAGDAAYTNALYQLSYKGAVPIGRTEDGSEIVGEVIAESAARGYDVAGGIVMTAEEMDQNFKEAPAKDKPKK